MVLKSGRPNNLAPGPPWVLEKGVELVVAGWCDMLLMVPGAEGQVPSQSLQPW